MFVYCQVFCHVQTLRDLQQNSHVFHSREVCVFFHEVQVVSLTYFHHFLHTLHFFTFWNSCMLIVFPALVFFIITIKYRTEIFVLFLSIIIIIVTVREAKMALGAIISVYHQ